MNKEYNNELKTGLWEKISQKGTKYYGGKIVVNKIEYYVNLFINEKQNEKQPDYNLMLKPTTEESLKSELKKDPYQEFGDAIEIDESEDLPF